ncbi:MAG: hypothetical protein J7L08_00400 [Candidatus Aenigmarchaeota archaeon]|nr:hypothetical protein [Candidatus Aenigmarchaeota archaeon]
MRKILMITTGEIDLEKRKKKIQEISETLSRYLDFYPVSNSISKYSVMGPVSKIIEMAKNRKNTPEFIKARALRMHEMNRISGYVSTDAIKIMEEAVDELLKFRQELSPIELSKTMEMIDYEVYFMRRKKNIERLEKIRKDFIKYIKGNYKNNIDELKSKWSKSDINDWNHIKFPTKTGKYFQEGNNVQQEDIDNFWKQHQSLEEQIIEEVDNG